MESPRGRIVVGSAASTEMLVMLTSITQMYRKYTMLLEISLLGKVFGLAVMGKIVGGAVTAQLLAFH